MWLRSQFCWQSDEVDRQMEFVMTVVKTIRSLRADYNLTRTRADCKHARTHTHTHAHAGTHTQARTRRHTRTHVFIYISRMWCIAKRN